MRAGLLPDGKVEAVRELQAAGRRVLLVGDGINDAPAMAAAELGVAMGRHGSDLALETSDAVIVRDDLATLPKVVGMSWRAHRVVKANLAFAATVITVLVIWDIIWILPLPLGVAGHEGSTVVVGLNRKIVSIPALESAPRKSSASSGGTSRVSTPSTPTFFARWTNSSRPIRRTGLA